MNEQGKVYSETKECICTVHTHTYVCLESRSPVWESDTLTRRLNLAVSRAPLKIRGVRFMYSSF